MSIDRHPSYGLADLRRSTEHLIAVIESGKLSKTVLREIVRRLEEAVASLDRDIPFVKREFDEAVEKTITRAKVEIGAHVSRTIMRVGVQALREQVQAKAPRLIVESEASERSESFLRRKPHGIHVAPYAVYHAGERFVKGC